MRFGVYESLGLRPGAGEWCGSVAFRKVQVGVGLVRSDCAGGCGFFGTLEKNYSARFLIMCV